MRRGRAQSCRNPTISARKIYLRPVSNVRGTRDSRRGQHQSGLPIPTAERQRREGRLQVRGQVPQQCGGELHIHSGMCSRSIVFASPQCLFPMCYALISACRAMTSCLLAYITLPQNCRPIGMPGDKKREALKLPMNNCTKQN